MSTFRISDTEVNSETVNPVISLDEISNNTKKVTTFSTTVFTNAHIPFIPDVSGSTTALVQSHKGFLSLDTEGISNPNRQFTIEDTLENARIILNTLGLNNSVGDSTIINMILDQSNSQGNHNLRLQTTPNTSNYIRILLFGAAASTFQDISPAACNVDTGRKITIRVTNSTITQGSERVDFDIIDRPST